MTSWKNRKKEALKKLASAKRAGEVDKVIVPLLDKLNSQNEYFTTSSCAGRITIMDIADENLKTESNFALRWHDKIKRNNLSLALERNFKNQPWFFFEPPILHVSCSSLEAAHELIKKALGAGFKKTALLSIPTKTVEIASSDRITMPLSKELPRNFLELMAELANEKLDSSREKLKKLEIHL